MASGPAMQARWRTPAHELPADHAAWRVEAHYLAQACATVTYVLSPEVIALGGGVMAQTHLFPMIRAELSALLNGYLAPPRVLPPVLPLPAITGALAMAADLHQPQ
jgi:fructokinase